MNVVRSLLFAILFYPGSALAVLTAVLVAPLGREPLTTVALGWARYHRLCARLLLRIRANVEGVVPRTPTLVASKHQSVFETTELVLLLDEPAVVLKRELSDLPGWGYAARRYGVIPVDRAGGPGALRRMLHAARAAVAAGRAILIFPEGTRVLPGEKPPLQAGFAGLYRSLDLPVVPVALDSGRLWPRRGFVKRRGIVTIRFGEPIPPGLPREEIEARVHAGINALED